jgi:hypothetical protein
MAEVMPVTARIIVKDGGPLLVVLVRRQDDRALLVAFADDLEEQVRTSLVQPLQD